MKFYLILIFILFTSIGRLQAQDTISIKLNINKRIITSQNDVYCAIDVLHTDTVIGRYNIQDSTFYFLVPSIDRLRGTKTILWILDNKGWYTINIGEYYDDSYSIPEFRNRKRLKLEIRRIKNITKYNGAIEYALGSGMWISGYEFYERSTSLFYKQTKTFFERVNQSSSKCRL